jgi:hypothetical protein
MGGSIHLGYWRDERIHRPPFREGPYWVPYPESGRRARWLRVEGIRLGVGVRARVP